MDLIHGLMPFRETANGKREIILPFIFEPRYYSGKPK